MGNCCERDTIWECATDNFGSVKEPLYLPYPTEQEQETAPLTDLGYS